MENLVETTSFLSWPIVGSYISSCRSGENEKGKKKSFLSSSQQKKWKLSVT